VFSRRDATGGSSPIDQTHKNKPENLMPNLKFNPQLNPQLNPHSNPQLSRREWLSHSAALAALLATAGMLPTQAQAAYNSAAFELKTMAELIKSLGGSTPVESKDVTLTAPDIAENGAVVPLGVSTALAGVKRLLVLVEKNPSVMSAMFDVTDAVDANFSTRVKMGQSSNVYAVAMMNDGKVLFAQKEVKVTLGGCGG
jgi:sulfur-oxidizing protein SoxY